MLYKLEREKRSTPPHCLFWTEYAHLTQSGECLKYIKPTIHRSPSFLSTAFHLCKAHSRGNACYDPSVILTFIQRGWFLVKNRMYSYLEIIPPKSFLSPFSYAAYARTSDWKRNLIKCLLPAFFSLATTALHYCCEATHWIQNRSWKAFRLLQIYSPDLTMTGAWRERKEVPGDNCGGALAQEWDHLLCVPHVTEFELHPKGMRSYRKIFMWRIKRSCL